MIELAALLTPAVKLQLLGLLKGAIALGGWDMITGALPNNKIKRLSVVFKAVNFTIRKAASILTCAANMIDGVQGYGTDKTDKV